MYHRKTKIIKTVRTKGKAGYLVWKSAEGQGDQDISLPFDLFEEFKIFLLFDSEVSAAKPLLIFKLKLNNNKYKTKKLLDSMKFFLTFYLNCTF